MKIGKVYKVENVQAGSFGFGEGNLGIVLKNQNHPKCNHGLCKGDDGFYIKKTNGEIWKTNGSFIKPSFNEVVKFYIELISFKLKSYENN